MLVVDTHTHVVSDDEDAYPLHPRDLTAAWYRDDPCSVERLLRLMDESGVDRVVLVQGMSAYGTDNRYTHDSARRYPGRCTSVAFVDLRLDEDIRNRDGSIEHADDLPFVCVRVYDVADRVPV